MNLIDEFLTHLMNKMPDLLTGETKKYEKELYGLYGNNKNSNLTYAMKLQNFKRYIVIIIILLFTVLLVTSANMLNNQIPFSIDQAGHKYIERPTYDQGDINAKLIVSGDVEGDTIKKPITLNIKPEGANSNKEDVKEKSVNLKEQVYGKLNLLVYSINKSDDLKRVYLPEHIEGMGNVSWNKDKNHPMLLIAFACGVLLFGTYIKRYNQIMKLKKSCNESIEEELPDFINKIVLLMNAGLVLSAAFEKIVKDYNYRAYMDKSYFYSQLTEINIKVAETNASMVEELKRLAERSKNREFMRISSVISDNIHKGTELVNILQGESSFLWFQRKKRAEEKGRIAETKLTMPLALQLLVLIIITLAPAMIEM
ncbi:hypothetical protein [Aminipila sp.]|uniref:hypothetical protein n=1 Tax=Aminipila sp. TaxID=2060095 RepID=UPI00289E4281|nr:hypothetical protein [Aminipila sp.]